MVSKNRLRIMMCGKTNEDVIKILHDKKICVDSARFSRAINETVNTPAAQRIRAAAEEIISGWEKEQGRVYDGNALGF